MATAKGWLYKSPRFRADIRVRRCGHTRAHANSGPSPKICTLPPARTWERIYGSYSYHHHKTRFFINHLNQASPTNVGLSLFLSFFSISMVHFWAIISHSYVHHFERVNIRNRCTRGGEQEFTNTFHQQDVGPTQFLASKMVHENRFL